MVAIKKEDFSLKDKETPEQIRIVHQNMWFRAWS